MYKMYASFDQYHTTLQRPFREHFTEPHVIANLIIYNENVAHERAKKDILDSYLRSVPNLVYYFVAYRTQEQDMIVEDHMIYVKGTEGFIPGILDKTMVGLRYINTTHEYSYLVRSNISTVLCWDRFPWKELKGHSYASTNVLRFIPDLPFAQGTNIILTRDAVEFLVENKDALDTKIIDDVALAKLLLTRYPLYELHDRIRINQSDLDEGWVYRNVTDADRDLDTERMKRLIMAL